LEEWKYYLDWQNELPYFNELTGVKDWRDYLHICLDGNYQHLYLQYA
jgi:hypothetical protein